jgi:hypothetical protein
MKCRLLLALLCAAVATPSLAAPGTDRNTRKIFKSFTECIVGKHPKEAAAVVLSETHSSDIIRHHSDLITPDCLDADQLQIPGGEFVLYGFAQALLRREYANGLPADVAQAAPLEHRAVEPEPQAGKRLSAMELAAMEKDTKSANALRSLSIYAECVARSDPPVALKLVLANPGSREETSAFDTLQPALSSCLEKGATITLDKAAVRGAIALNLYRLAKAPRAAAAAPAK